MQGDPPDPCTKQTLMHQHPDQHLSAQVTLHLVLTSDHTLAVFVLPQASTHTPVQPDPPVPQSEHTQSHPLSLSPPIFLSSSHSHTNTHQRMSASPSHSPTSRQTITTIHQRPGLSCSCRLAANPTNLNGCHDGSRGRTPHLSSTAAVARQKQLCYSSGDAPCSGVVAAEEAGGVGVGVGGGDPASETLGPTPSTASAASVPMLTSRPVTDL